jgi:hypothetical protein
MRWMSLLACSVALLGARVAIEAQPTPAKQAGSPQPEAKSAPAAALLPDAFDGWVEINPPKMIADVTRVDPDNAAALKEFDFTGAQLANYKRSGETLSLRALRFRDASGSYGAYSFYRQNGWPKEDIGAGATSNHNRVLFWVGDTVVDANFSHLEPMSGSELREVASRLPSPDGSRALAPPILSNLPQSSLDSQTTHYALGPAGYAGSGGVLPPDLVGFDRGAETVTANYSLRSGVATLTIIDYPTPQMAATQESKIRAYLKAGAQPQPAWPKPLQDSDPASLEVRRSGPLVAIVSGDAIPDESHKLLAMVHYEANLISIPQPGGESDVSKTSRLLLGIAGLVIIGASAAILLGFFLGGGRALYRMARGRPVSSVYEEEFIRIDLRDDLAESVAVVDSPNPKR